LLAPVQVPCAVVELTRAEPVPGFVVVTCTVILWMKLLSYAHCNHDFRRAFCSLSLAACLLSSVLPLYLQGPRQLSRMSHFL
jgi:hypothetical protein